ncbi:MAG TPA: serine/threonine-protein kinase [Thermoanaerobaculia bacterium]|nr:serine/threonine-protein kinase [Thermoanaerobaculia bacterium]
MITPDAEETARVESDARYTPQYRGSDPQFAPGTLIAGRYRIASILGKGGMGEVYRADDIKLGQAVALKFLPARLARDPILLARLHDEVRLGRQVAHPNVCRTYDIIEWQDAHFVAMEYVDGEDLARLLHRIGRLAHDKAVDIARGIAAGLSAAHAKGILHRDLKPANVMIDSHGDARMTDFGLALTADDEQLDIAGTPAYMAPELLRGTPATIQSDLYALGLVMYELFTGKRAHAARTFAERSRETETEIRTPSTFIRDIDPAVERVILRCLDREPSQRPRSAREVIDALPGGDPLKAAMLAGETPSPRLIAAAAAQGTLKPRTAWTLLALTFVLLTVIIVSVRVHSMLRFAGADKPPAALAEHAEEVLARLGVPRQVYRAGGFQEHRSFIAWLVATDHSRNRWQRLRRGPPALSFWLRESPEPLAREALVSANVPPLAKPGMSLVRVDPRGRFLGLTAVPDDAWPKRANDWRSVLALAGFDLAKLTPAAPAFTPPVFADDVRAWSGTHPDDGTPVRIEAASYRGTPVYFEITGPWQRAAPGKLAFGGNTLDIAFLALAVIAIGASIVLAWRNVRARRGDRQGAARVATALFAIQLVASLGLASHTTAFVQELDVVVTLTAGALFTGACAWIIYLALEPFVRRRWPDRLISWTRLLSGNWRDPMVGRDVLIGIVAGLMHTTLALTSRPLAELTGPINAGPHTPVLQPLMGVIPAAAQTIRALSSGMVQGLVFMIGLMLLTIVLRRRTLAIGALFMLLATVLAVSARDPWISLMSVLIALMITLVAARVGLLAISVLQAVFAMTFFYPITVDGSWYAGIGAIPLLVVSGAAIWAFRSSLAGQSPWPMDDFA